MLHYFNPCEGNGQSHTFCRATMTVEEYNEYLNASETAPVVVCPECNKAADAQDEYAYHYDL